MCIQFFPRPLLTPVVGDTVLTAQTFDLSQCEERYLKLKKFKRTDFLLKK